MSIEFQFGKMKSSGDGSTTVRMYLIPLNCTSG